MSKEKKKWLAIAREAIIRSDVTDSSSVDDLLSLEFGETLSVKIQEWAFKTLNDLEDNILNSKQRQ